MALQKESTDSSEHKLIYDTDYFDNINYMFGALQVLKMPGYTTVYVNIRIPYAQLHVVYIQFSS